MTILAPKRPTEVRRYVLDWEHQLGDDAIEGFTLGVTSGSVTIQSSEQAGPRAVAFLLAGGSDQETSTLELVVTTAAGQTLYRSAAITVLMATTGVFPSTTTKGQIEDMAFEECGLAGYAFDATAAEQASGLRRLDALMAMWANQGLDLGYNFPTAVGGSARADFSGIPDLALDAVVVKLALSIAPGIGKALSVESRTRMNESMRALRAAYAVIPEIRLPSRTARGAGAKPTSTWWPFMGRRFGPGGVGSANAPSIDNFDLDRSTLDGPDFIG